MSSTKFGMEEMGGRIPKILPRFEDQKGEDSNREGGIFWRQHYERVKAWVQSREIQALIRSEMFEERKSGEAPGGYHSPRGMKRLKRRTGRGKILTFPSGGYDHAVKTAE